MKGAITTPLDATLETRFREMARPYSPKDMSKVMTVNDVIDLAIGARDANRGVPVPAAVRQQIARVFGKLDLEKIIPKMQKGEKSYDRNEYVEKPAEQEHAYCVYDESVEPPELVLERPDPTRKTAWKRSEEARETSSRFTGVSWRKTHRGYRMYVGRWPNKGGPVYMLGPGGVEPGDESEMLMAVSRDAILMERWQSFKRSEGTLNLNFKQNGIPTAEEREPYRLTEEAVRQQAAAALDWYRKELAARQ